MFQFAKLIFLILFFAVLQGCNTLYNTASLKIEILVPGKIEIPPKYRKAAIKYNNSNVVVNPNFNFYMEDNTRYVDLINMDSIASEIYYNVFYKNLKNQQFFDTIIEIEKSDYTGIVFNDSLIYSQFKPNETGDSVFSSAVRSEVFRFTKLIDSKNRQISEKSDTKFIDPEFGLYTKNEIDKITDTTGADLLLSFDYFASVDGIFSRNFQFSSKDSALIKDVARYYSNTGREVVNVLTGWNFYDLEKQELIYSYIKTDTVKWFENAVNLREAKRALPPRKEAVFNAADIAARRFTEFLVPHWIEVDRMYYKSGHSELKKTEQLIKQNRWIEAAEIWKKNTTSKNKSVAAKSMYNMALACEMNGDMEAAIDWCVKSFYIFGSDNLVHAENCKDYIRILGLRKMDIKAIE